MTASASWPSASVPCSTGARPGPARCSAGRAGSFQGAWCPPSSRAGPGRSTWRAARGRASGTWTATSTSTCTTASAPWSKGTPTPPSARPSPSAIPGAPTSRRPPRTRSWWPRSWRGASGFRSGASPTRAPRRRWRPYGSPARTRAATTCSRSAAATTATTTWGWWAQAGRAARSGARRAQHRLQRRRCDGAEDRRSPAKGASRPACSWSP